MLCKYLNVFVVVYLNNIVVYSSCKEDYEKHVHKVLKALAKTGLYIKLSKYQFDTYKIDFLEYKITSKEIFIKLLQVEIILSWPES